VQRHMRLAQTWLVEAQTSSRYPRKAIQRTGMTSSSNPVGLCHVLAHVVLCIPLTVLVRSQDYPAGKIVSLYDLAA
jgi:hypothetical protein